MIIVFKLCVENVIVYVENKVLLPQRKEQKLALIILEKKCKPMICEK